MRWGLLVQYTSMNSGATSVPLLADILCESCGYTLNGLPPTGNCPECGTSIAFSTAESGRSLPAWETERAFWPTTRRVVFQTSQFYRTLKTRVAPANHRAAYLFALRHWFLAGLLIALASGLHYSITDVPLYRAGAETRLFLMFLWVAMVTAVAGFGIMAVTHLAAWLTAWEAGWRGYRLPREVVLRGMCYHAAHLLPVAAIILAIVAGFRTLWWLGVAGYESLVAYLIILSIAAVLGAIYLFWTYWIGMRNMLYAND